jgi:hypothetical protein
VQCKEQCFSIKPENGKKEMDGILFLFSALFFCVTQIPYFFRFVLHENSDKIMCCRKADHEPEMVIDLSKSSVSDQEVKLNFNFVLSLNFWTLLFSFR